MLYSLYQEVRHAHSNGKKAGGHPRDLQPQGTHRRRGVGEGRRARGEEAGHQAANSAGRLNASLDLAGRESGARCFPVSFFMYAPSS